MSSTERTLAETAEGQVLEPMRAAEQATAFHWPKFTGALCGTQTDRERLGLPPGFAPDRFFDTLPAALDEIRGDSVEQLLAILDDPAHSLVLRFAAGQLLALLGDPRLVPTEPAMVDISGGQVEIGLGEDEVEWILARFDHLGLDRDWIRKECPRHGVHLKPYRIARFPVTNQEYGDFLLATGYPELPASWSFRRFPRERANHPVYGVSPRTCDLYAEWLSVRTGRKLRLPTEAEWEYAAAGPAGLEFPWGLAFDATRCNCCETGIFETTPVGMFPDGVSPFGVHDMAGNVEEYVAENYAAYPGGPVIDDHLSQIHGTYRVARGGSFARFRDLARTRRRHGQNPRSITYAMGFRLAESP